MCEFCTQHGEGKKWYLQTKNFMNEMLDQATKDFMVDMFERLEENTGNRPSPAPRGDAPPPDPAAVKEMLRKRLEEQKKKHFGQVITIDDVEQVFDLTASIVRTPCLCRSVTRGIWNSRFCFHFAAVETDFWPKGIFEQWPDYNRELEVLTKDEAKKALRKLDHQGLVHTVWSYGDLFAASICNCSSTDCLGFRAMEGPMRPFFKGEYVAAINIEECNGCRNCMKMCSFNAIQYSPASDKCTINQMKCLGCGVCRVECSREAITMFDRNQIPVLAEVW